MSRSLAVGENRRLVAIPLEPLTTNPLTTPISSCNLTRKENAMIPPVSFASRLNLPEVAGRETPPSQPQGGDTLLERLGLQEIGASDHRQAAIQADTAQTQLQMQLV